MLKLVPTNVKLKEQLKIFQLLHLPENLRVLHFSQGDTRDAVRTSFDGAKKSNKNAIRAVCNKLEMLKNLRALIFNIRLSGSTDFSELQKVCASHPNLMYLVIYSSVNILEHSYRGNRKRVLREHLCQEYTVLKQLGETRLVFVGDGRSGKTSTIRSLIGLDFRVKERSTLLLDLKYIIRLSDLEYSAPLTNRVTRHEISLQRILFNLPQHIDLETQQQNIASYNFSFEDELIESVLEMHYYSNEYAYGGDFHSLRKDVSKYLLVSDFGGQETFYAVHHLFLSSFGLVCLVFNAAKLDSNHLEKFRFWCESLVENASSATIFLIGTHWKKAEKIYGANAFEIVNYFISQVLNKLRTRLRIVMNKDLLFFPIENSNIHEKRELISNLKLELHSEIMESGIEMKQQFVKAIPFGHIVFMDNLQQEHTHLPLTVFEQKAFESGFTPEEIPSLLSVYADSGLIFYEEKMKYLPKDTNMVILSPSWLATALAKFIHDPEFHNFALQISKSSFVEYRKYISTGILSMCLLEDTLRRYNSVERKYIIELCLQMQILIKDPRLVIGEESFIVPTSIPKLTKEEISALKLDKSYHFKILSRKVFTNYDFVSFIFVIWVKSKDNSVSNNSLVSKYFARIVVSNDLQISVSFLRKENCFGICAQGYLGFETIKLGCLEWNQGSLLREYVPNYGNKQENTRSLMS
eukprot:snap_masked-scaffold_22-processed-gene-5.51-mRNA-1 protein AED:1.00 eAED:1.00 QI:0/0/0/0/1/1/4/0/692